MEAWSIESILLRCTEQELIEERSFHTKIVMLWKIAGIVYNARIISMSGLNGKRYVGDPRLFTFLFQLLLIRPKDHKHMALDFDWILAYYNCRSCICKQTLHNAYVCT
ncbi:hypothetical protein V1477_009379 [Vespula maculifrons]|uniref:Uncharacterized protein n=1 Tax=Vespula maculifrons TaxID=7453 RepID=A0ABD2C9M9_VESMC